MTNFTDDPEKIGRNSNKRKSRNMADAGNEDPQCQQPEEHQEDETGNEDTSAPTEMYLPDLDNTPLSQALKNGLDWGMEDEVMVECPKLKQYFGVDTLLVQRTSGQVRLHTKDEGRDIPHQLLKNQVPNPPTQKGPGRSRTTKSNPQGSTRRRLATENQDHPTKNGIRQQTGCICRTSQQVCKKFSLSRTCTHGEQRLNRWVL